MYAEIAAGLLVFISVAHSVLGEKEILQPLFGDDRWATELPRWVHERILRFAWHLTSVAWVGLAFLVLGVDGATVVVGVGLTSATVIAISLPGHFAWPVFIAAGWTAAASQGMVPNGLMRGTMVAGAAIALALGGLHIYWAMGGKRWLEAALPERSGSKAFEPGRLTTLLVASLLLMFAGLLITGLLSTDAGSVAPTWVRWAAGLAAAILGLRAVGDGRYAGFTKTVRSTAFARRDDLFYTPTAVALAASAVAVIAI